MSSEVALVETNDLYLVDVLLLCSECGQPIKARINTPYWIRCEFIGPNGECQGCYQQKKRATAA